MKFSKATNYALHSMVHLAMESGNEAIKVEDLASRQKLSPTYLSKILTKLAKANLIESTPGVKGGYRLLRAPEECTFLDVIRATEGYESLLNCTMSHDGKWNKSCLIERAMSDVENKMEEELANKTIAKILSEMHTEN
ncbi:Rrf2 family transcriptional regulator [Marinilactibacillus psychrotolerans]|uniref:Rrf2 family transcriptional regulator n=1 Tax=Marinilactibacillus psychrotolerans TaxID=191770 RepID=A0AAV3WW09_9LACT|nr:Rrf2 family transcriptional regulator [Marinilactibacillus psychrotolerans]GEL66709.1 Rrf2 family transcriptional regulator [Marinilactibacillus psychrotolerans]GEQ35844.1 Rrf2 family transcriptional regulator [Marinilactibacillus psychrotolerans]